MKVRAPNVLVLDDDSSYCEETSAYLRLHGCTVRAIQDPVALEAMLEQETPDIVLLDKCLGDTTATELLRRMRARSDIPCIVVTGRPDEMDRIVNLEIGADDELSKAVAPRELLARIRTVLRRYERVPAYEPESRPEPAAPAPAGRWEMSTARRELRAPDGTLCHLTSAEFDTLAALCRAQGSPVSRERLFKQVFQRHYSPTDRAVDTVIRKVREKLGRWKAQDSIKTVRNAGYVFVGFPEASNG